MKKEEVIIVLGLLLFLQGYLLENVFPAILGFSITLYLAYLRNGFKPNIEVEWRVDNTLEEGKKIVSEVILKNRSRASFNVLLLSDFLPPKFKSEIRSVIVKKGQEKTVDFTLIPYKGRYTIKGPKLKIFDLRGLYQECFIGDSEVEVEVVPSLDKIKEEIIVDENLRIASEYRKFLMGLQTMDLHSLKKFQPGDDTKHIEWKATARLGELIIKDFLREVEEDIYLILDAGREMRKEVMKSKIDYAIYLTLYLSQIIIKRHRVGIIVYDDYRIIYKLKASKSPEHIQKILRMLTISPIQTHTLGLKVPELVSRVSIERGEFVRKIVPALKRRRGASSGVAEVASHVSAPSTLIFIADITSNTSELIRTLTKLKHRHKIFLLTPNPILFYDESNLDRDAIIRLYRRYVEREELIKKFNRIVPTLDLGPSDFFEVVRGVSE